MISYFYIQGRQSIFPKVANLGLNCKLPQVHQESPEYFWWRVTQSPNKVVKLTEQFIINLLHFVSW